MSIAYIYFDEIPSPKIIEFKKGNNLPLPDWQLIVWQNQIVQAYF